MATQSPRISVSMILKNAERTLPRLLASLEWRSDSTPPGAEARRFCFNEIIFVDTGSTDDTYNEIMHWLDPSLPVLPHAGIRTGE